MVSNDERIMSPDVTDDITHGGPQPHMLVVGWSGAQRLLQSVQHMSGSESLVEMISGNMSDVFGQIAKLL